MRKLLIIIALFTSGATAQTNYVLKTTLPIKADQFTTDNLDNIYLRKGNEIVKYDPNSDVKNIFSNKLLGEISTIDVTNPLKVVLFYRDLTQVAFLDNMMSPQGDPVALEKHNLEQVTLVASSHNNGLWVYDLNTLQLIRLDKEFRISHETGNLIQVLGFEVNPNFLVERNNWVYLNDPSIGILVFDIYGTYYKTIPIKELDSFQILDQVIYYQRDKKLFGFNMQTLEEAGVELPDQDFIQVRVGKQYLYLLDDNGLKIFRAKS